MASNTNESWSEYLTISDTNSDSNSDDFKISKIITSMSNIFEEINSDFNYKNNGFNADSSGSCADCSGSYADCSGSYADSSTTACVGTANVNTANTAANVDTANADTAANTNANTNINLNANTNINTNADTADVGIKISTSQSNHNHAIDDDDSLQWISFIPIHKLYHHHSSNTTSFGPSTATRGLKITNPDVRETNHVSHILTSFNRITFDPTFVYQVPSRTFSLKAAPKASAKISSSRGLSRASTTVSTKVSTANRVYTQECIDIEIPSPSQLNLKKKSSSFSNLLSLLSTSTRLNPQNIIPFDPCAEARITFKKRYSSTKFLKSSSQSFSKSQQQQSTLYPSPSTVSSRVYSNLTYLNRSYPNLSHSKLNVDPQPPKWSLDIKPDPLSLSAADQMFRKMKHMIGGIPSLPPSPSSPTTVNYSTSTSSSCLSPTSTFISFTSNLNFSSSFMSKGTVDKKNAVTSPLKIQDESREGTQEHHDHRLKPKRN